MITTIKITGLGADTQMYAKQDKPMQNVITELKSFQSFHDAKRFISQLPRDASGASIVGDLRIELDAYENLKKEAEALKKLEQFDVKIAPVCQELIKIGEDGGALITKVQGSGPEGLQRLSQPSVSESNLPAEVKQAFLADFTKVLDGGWANPQAERIGSWFINPSTGHVVLSPWRGLVKAEKSKSEDLLEELRFMLRDPK